MGRSLSGSICPSPSRTDSSALALTIWPRSSSLSSSKLISRHYRAMGSSSMRGASTNWLLVVWKPARATLSGTFLADTSPT